MTEVIRWIAGIWLCVINFTAFGAYGVDKYKALKGKWRISEKRLWGLALVGGSLGALLGMKVFHHKTKKRKFSWGVPVILCLHLAVAAGILFYFR